MAEQPENQPISDEERATWVREQFQKANKFLAENGVNPLSKKRNTQRAVSASSYTEA